MDEQAIEQMLRTGSVMTARLAEDLLNEDRWTYQAVMLVESDSLLAATYIKRIATTCNECNPYSISVISHESIINCVPLRISRHVIYYQANECLKCHSPIPTPLMALLIKDAILHLKMDFIARETKKGLNCNTFDQPNVTVTMVNVILIGFYDPHILFELRKIKINLISLVCVSPEGTTRSLSLSLQTKNRTGQDIVGSSEVRSFWSNYSKIKLADSDCLREIAGIHFCPLYFPHSSLTIADDQTTILEQLSQLMQDLSDCISQYRTFNKAALVIKYDYLTPDENIFNDYSNLMNEIPGEITTMALILNNIMNAVEHSIDEDVNVEKHDDPDKSIRQIRKSPIVVDHLNKAKMMSINANFDIERPTVEQLKSMPVLDLWKNYPEPTEKQKILHAYHLNQMCACYNNASIKTDSVKRFLHLLCCQKLLDLKSTGSEIRDPRKLNNALSVSQFKDNLRCHDSISPLRLNSKTDLDNLKAFNIPRMTKLHEVKFARSHEDLFMFMNDEMKQLLCYDDATRSVFNSPKNILRGYNAFEKMTESMMVQSLHEAYQSSTNIIYKYFKLTDTIVLLFQNETDLLKRNMSDWRVILPTPSGFGDFCFYLLSGGCPWVEIKEVHKKSFKKRRPRSSTTHHNVSNSPKSSKRRGKSTLCPKSVKNVEISQTSAVLYDLKQVCVELSGESTSFLSEDGTKVIATRENFNMNNSDNMLMVQITLNNHTMTFYKNLSQNEFSDQLKFRISSEDGAEFVFKDSKEISETIPATLETHISLPTGLYIRPIIIATGPSYVKQNYVDESRLKEKYRCISTSGSVLIFRKDGSVETMRPGGERFICHKFVDTRTDAAPAPSSARTKSSKSRKRKVKLADSVYGESSHRGSSPKTESFIEIVGYKKVDSRGVFREYLDGAVIKTIRTFDSRVAVDSFNGEIFINRMDGTNTLWKEDGTMISSFPDGTIITSEVTIDDLQFLVTFTAAEEREFEKDKYYFPPFTVFSTIFKMEHPMFATVTANSAFNTLTIDTPNKYRLVIKSNGKQTLYLDERTKFELGGLDVNAKCLTCFGCASNTTLIINVSHLLSTSRQATRREFLDSHYHQSCHQYSDETVLPLRRQSLIAQRFPTKLEKDRSYLLKVWDSCGKIFTLNAEGKAEAEIMRMTTPVKQEDPKRDLCKKNCSRVNCMTANKLSFFSVNRDFSGEEYFHENKYKWRIAKAPELWETQIQRTSNHESFMTFTQRLKPIVDSQTKWKMSYRKSSAKPKSLVRSDSRFFDTSLHNGSWMELWPGVMEERTKKVHDILKYPKLLSIRTFQMYEGLNWEQLTINAARRFSQYAERNFRDFQKTPFNPESCIREDGGHPELTHRNYHLTNDHIQRKNDEA